MFCSASRVSGMLALPTTSFDHMLRQVGLAILCALIGCAQAQSLSSVSSAASIAATPTPTPITWTITGHPVSEYELADTTDAGRRVTLRRTTLRALAPGTFGSSSARIPATSFAGKRIRVTAELRTHYARQGASLWIRLDDKANRMLALDNGKERMLGSNFDWTTWTTEMYVVPETDHVTFGADLNPA